MAERGNTTHGPNLDDQLKHETGGLIQGNRPTRAEEWRETETVDDGGNDDDNAVGDARPGYDGGAVADDGPLTEPIEDKVRNDDEETQ
jgi:hypothetical protein